MSDTKTAEQPKAYHCLEVFKTPPSVLSLSAKDRKKVVKGLVKSCGPEGFKENEFSAVSEMPLFNHIVAVFGLFVLLGLPLLWIVGLVILFFAGSWFQFAIFLALTIALAVHPLPQGVEEWCNTSIFTHYMYQYFTFRFLWTGDVMEQLDVTPRWVGVSPPHGLLPLANLLSMPAINAMLGTHFVGAAASALFTTPFLRYVTLSGLIPADRRSIADALDGGACVGVCPDGVAGVFKMNESDETVLLAQRKGLAKLALRTGYPLLPAYSVGNTQTFSAWFDSYGVMEALSRKLRGGVLLYWGRFFLPIAYRVPITMLLGSPIHVTKVEGREPTAAEVDAVHAQLLGAMTQMFDTHKKSLGWGHKQLRFV